MLKTAFCAGLLLLVATGTLMSSATSAEAGGRHSVQEACTYVCLTYHEWERWQQVTNWSGTYWFPSLVRPRPGRCAGYECVVREPTRIYSRCGTVCGPVGTYACYRDNQGRRLVWKYLAPSRGRK